MTDLSGAGSGRAVLGDGAAGRSLPPGSCGEVDCAAEQRRLPAQYRQFARTPSSSVFCLGPRGVFSEHSGFLRLPLIRLVRLF